MTETGTTATATLMMTATYDRYDGPGTLQHVYFVARFDNRFDAELFAVRFPVSAKMRIESVMSGQSVNGLPAYYQVSSTNTLLPSKRNGKLNEAGVKRVRTILARAATYGIEVQYHTQFGNSFPTREAFETILAEIEASV
jgi:hypothetical protein